MKLSIQLQGRAALHERGIWPFSYARPGEAGPVAGNLCAGPPRLGMPLARLQGVHKRHRARYLWASLKVLERCLQAPVCYPSNRCVRRCPGFACSPYLCQPYRPCVYPNSILCRTSSTAVHDAPPFVSTPWRQVDTRPASLQQRPQA